MNQQTKDAIEILSPYIDAVGQFLSTEELERILVPTSGELPTAFDIACRYFPRETTPFQQHPQDADLINWELVRTWFLARSHKPAIYGVAELAELLEVAPATIRQWLHKNKLPRPTWRLNATPVWADYDIARWIAHHQPEVP